MRWLLLLLCLTTLAWAAPEQADPVKTLKLYYENLGSHFVLDAYRLRSAASQKALTADAFEDIWSSNVEVSAAGFALTPPGTINFTIKAVDFDKTTGARERAEYAGTAQMVRQKNLWWVEDIQVQKLSSTPIRGLELGPGQTVVEGKPPDPLPADVPIYAGFRMSAPLLLKDASAPKGERTVLSTNRIPKLRVSQVSDFYQQTLGAAGWKTTGPAGGGTSVTVTFTKGDRKIYIDIYQTLYSGTDVGIDPRGTRLEIRY